jgi:hypothetical protein
MSHYMGRLQALPLQSRLMILSYYGQNALAYFVFQLVAKKESLSIENTTW